MLLLCVRVSGRRGGGWASEAWRSDPGGEQRESPGSDARAGGRHPEEAARNRHAGRPVIMLTYACRHTHVFTQSDWMSTPNFPTSKKEQSRTHTDSCLCIFVRTPDCNTHLA